jgi:microcin C transport system ATP-binding protein
MQIVFQDSGSAFNPRLSVGEQVAFPMRKFRLHPDKEIHSRVIELLEQVGLRADQAQRYPHEFSGGQRQRLGIARALASQPDFVVLDEPTSALDMSVQAQVVDLLRELQARHRLAYLFISHDLKVIRAVSDEILVMRDGRVVEQGPTERIFEQPEQAYTRALMAAAFDLEPLEEGGVRT